MTVLIFILGFILAVAIMTLFNIGTIRAAGKKRKRKTEENPETKFSTTKIIVFSIMATYYIAFGVGVWVVIKKDFYQLGTLLTFVGSIAAFAVAFYCWKSKAENLLKIKTNNPELQGSLSDFSGMASQ